MSVGAAGHLGIALSNLRVNWLRSALAILGMVFGTGAVIATLSSNEGAKQFVASELKKLGTNILTIQTADRPWPGADDRELVLRYSSRFKSLLVATSLAGASLAYGTHVVDASVTGVEIGYFDALRLALRRGRLFTQGESDDAAPVMVLGAAKAEELFGQLDPVGHYVHLWVAGKPFVYRVIGLLAPKGVNSGINFDTGAYVSPRTIVDLSPTAPAASLSAVLRNDEETAQAKREVTALLAPRFADRLQIQDAREAIERTRAIWQNQNLVGLLLAAISLLTGGVGIMNVMLLSIHQRRREIGLRKALGATRANITLQFLLEAVLICLLGGLCGVAAGWAFGRRVAALLGQWEASTSPVAVAVAIGFAMAVGLFFGLVPAIRASRLDPYEALRSF